VSSAGILLLVHVAQRNVIQALRIMYKRPLIKGKEITKS